MQLGAPGVGRAGCVVVWAVVFGVAVDEIQALSAEALLHADTYISFSLFFAVTVNLLDFYWIRNVLLLMVTYAVLIGILLLLIFVYGTQTKDTKKPFQFRQRHQLLV